MVRRTRMRLRRLLGMYMNIENEKKKMVLVPKRVSQFQEELFFTILDTSVYFGRISIKDAKHAREEAEKILREIET